jgi:penicillin-binding protein 1A
MPQNRNLFNWLTRRITKSQLKSSPFDYPVEYIRQELEDKYTTRVAQGGLSVYTTINVDAQKRAYDVVRAGLRNYDRTHTGWRSSYSPIPTASNNAEGLPTQQELVSYKHPDWYGNDYAVDRHLMGLVMKVDRVKKRRLLCASVISLLTVTAADMGWGKRRTER